jgi:hypothetical protein
MERKRRRKRRKFGSAQTGVVCMILERTVKRNTSFDVVEQLFQTVFLAILGHFGGNKLAIQHDSETFLNHRMIVEDESGLIKHQMIV